VIELAIKYLLIVLFSFYYTCMTVHWLTEFKCVCISVYFE